MCYPFPKFRSHVNFHTLAFSLSVNKHFDGATKKTSEVTKDSSLDEAMDSLTLTTGTNSDDEMTEYLENIVEPKSGGARPKSTQNQQQTRKKKKAKRKGKK